MKHYTTCVSLNIIGYLYDILDELDRLLEESMIDYGEYSIAFIKVNTDINNLLGQYNCPVTFNIN